MSAEDTDPQQFAPVQLGALERQVMEALWGVDDLTIREVITALGDVHAYTTIATVMTNLDRKGMVCSRREGRSVRYSPRHSRSVHAARAMEHALSASNDRTASILHFVKSMNPDDVDLLRGYLRRQDGNDHRSDP